ncbi:GAF domain-containing protein [Herbaspirillum sp. RTI4]|uniref:GAF domain-containing protein n=1 Tax=Herbaspirillum sp. RTI4 TaxID=3048640 RepID=UPI002AB329FF|nr:GAF domain-containing protein [Herbaspirillum sp. RTI4]MDY7579176.1 GAF domain-containing protein [Herbaspirillum sp. RTI4]MEA9983224.1 GAF domain-containing protein [Herbaspirillum sp. RTI4]
MTQTIADVPPENANELGRDILALLHQNADKASFSALQQRLDALPPDTKNKPLLLHSMQMATTIQARFEQYQQRERGLNAVIETAQDLTAIRDLDHVLQAIVHRARKLMGTDVGYLSVIDREQGDFYVRATDGAFSEKFKRIRVGRDIGICGYVALNKTPYSSSEYRADPRFAHTHPIDAAVTEEGIVSILGVPLLSGAEVIGVLFVGDRYARAYDAWEMSILSTLTAHAAVAIDNARLFQETQVALKQVSDANALLKKQTEGTLIAAEAHEQLTSLVAKGGGLKELCEMVANMLNGDVTVIDEGEQTLHVAGKGLLTDKGEAHAVGSPSQKLLHAHQDSIHAAMMESRIIGRSVAALTTPEEVCRVSAVVGNRGLLGGLIIRTPVELNEVEVRILERSSMVTGVVLLSQERQDDAARQEIPALFRGLLSQPQAKLSRLLEQAARHGLDLTQPFHLAVVQINAERSAYLLRKWQSAGPMRHTLCDAIDDTMVFISSVAVQEELRQFLYQFFSQEIRHPVTGVLSRQETQLAALPASYQSMLRCLSTASALGRSGAIFLEQELSLYAVLFEKRGEADLDAFLSAMLGKLYHADKQRRTELARTLLTYLDKGHNARAAASALGVHINTFRQRLEAIDALIGNWNEAGRALEIHVALRLWKLREDENGINSVTHSETGSEKP